MRGPVLLLETKGSTISFVNFRELPPPGPAWGGSLMGTAMVAILCVTEGLMQAAAVFTTLAWIIFAVLLIGFLRYRQPRFTSATMAEWAMFFIGILALGSANWWYTDEALFGEVALWIAGPVLLVIWGNQVARLVRRKAGEPAFTWGLPLVGPMIMAATAGFVGGPFYHTLGVVCFFLSLLTAVPVFARVYIGVLQNKVDLRGNKAATAWIPLGVVGQSTSAAGVLFDRHVALAYGSVTLTLGIPLAIFGMLMFYPQVRHRSDYAPSWWASTFPTGTISLGTQSVAAASGNGLLLAVSLSMPVILFAHWVICSVRFLEWLYEFQDRSETATETAPKTAPKKVIHMAE